MVRQRISNELLAEHYKSIVDQYGTPTKDPCMLDSRTRQQETIAGLTTNLQEFYESNKSLKGMRLHTYRISPKTQGILELILKRGVADATQELENARRSTTTFE